MRGKGLIKSISPIVKVESHNIDGVWELPIPSEPAIITFVITSVEGDASIDSINRQLQYLFARQEIEFEIK